ncbi:VanZ family protein [Zhihengliuella halotolerans]|uniref:VanZ family protein n=1 Tax=Zhihengliuella halotolerans TaxID=370736 RepID=UPI000C805242|nr:VanZ family protein [Zhihengliuella halotolerans]
MGNSVEAWVWPAYIGILFGCLAFAAVLIPVVIYQYRRYGGFTWLRFLGAAAVAIYGAALIAYTLLPLPVASDLMCPPGTTGLRGMLAQAQLTPFQFLDDIARGTAGMSLLERLKSFVVLQVVFNVILFIPWGVIARRFLGWGVVGAVFTGMLATGFIELTQVTGVYGIYDCAYRVGDVDDLIANTAGALLGALIAPLLLWFMPERRQYESRRLTPRPLTVWRRWFGMVIDLVLFGVFGGVLSVLYGVFLIWTEVPESPWVVALTGYVVPALLVFYLPALAGTGGSLGQRVVWLGVTAREPGTGSRHDGVASPSAFPVAGLGRRLVRASIVGGPYAVLTMIGELWESDFAGLANGATGLLLFVAFVSVMATSTRRGLSGVLSGTYLADFRRR